MRHVPPQRTAPHRARNVRKNPRNRRKPNYKLLFLLFVSAAVVSGAASFALQTPALVVKEVQIKGVHLTRRAEVERAAKAVLGRNIILLRTSLILKSVSRCHEVALVKMGRRFPDKVWVRVWERKPEAVLTDSGTYCMVQGDCLAFHKTEGPVRHVPVLQVARCGRILEGSKCDSEDVAAGLAVLRCAKHNGIPVAKISVDRLGDMCLNMEGGFYVKLGQPDDVARTMSVLRTVLTYRPSITREGAYIDLSYPSAPVWKPRSAAG